MNLSFFLFATWGFILFGTCSIFISDAEGKGKTQSDAEPEVGNKQVLVDSFRDLVRYVMLKTHRDVTKFGVTEGNFSVEAMDTSLAARSNAEIFGRGTPSLARLLKKARGPSLTFHFYWKTPVAQEPLEATFGLSYERDGDLKVRLLWLGLPELIPISPRLGAVEGRKPLEEAVAELLRIHRDGRLAPYPPE